MIEQVTIEELLAQAREDYRTINRLRLALEQIARMQPRMLEIIESNGFVFDDIGSDPGNWQHLAFSIYTDLCEVDTIARSALKAQ